MALASSPIISAVGRLQTMGSNRRMTMARAYPAPPRMSSMAYGPPDTMKNVAAMRGKNRIFRFGARWLRGVAVASAGLDIGDMLVNLTDSPARTKYRWHWSGVG